MIPDDNMTMTNKIKLTKKIKKKQKTKKIFLFVIIYQKN
jgi:hypothetical protein